MTLIQHKFYRYSLPSKLSDVENPSKLSDVLKNRTKKKIKTWSKNNCYTVRTFHTKFISEHDFGLELVTWFFCIVQLKMLNSDEEQHFHKVCVKVLFFSWNVQLCVRSWKHVHFSTIMHTRAIMCTWMKWFDYYSIFCGFISLFLQEKLNFNAC